MPITKNEATRETMRAKVQGTERHLKLLSRCEIEREYGLSRRWLELAALSGNGPPMVRISARMVRYRRGDIEDWLAARTVSSTSEEISTT